MESFKIKELQQKIDDLGTGSQGQLFHVEKQIEHDGIEMGVLENGIPYLSESGLARMCGINRSSLNRLAAGWAEEKTKPRGRVIQALLSRENFDSDTLFIRCESNGIPINAYTEPVCIALLEYYAFEASEQKEEAQNAFRTLARISFRSFVYTAVGYRPETDLLSSWKHFIDRVDLTANAVPKGYFCIFSEIAPIVVPMIKAGLIVTDKVIPDISVGKLWSKYWTDNNLDNEMGERIRFPHNYPDYYRQALSNPQPAYAYPEVALGLFRSWLRTYIESKFPKYLLTKAKEGFIEKESATKALALMNEDVKKLAT